MSLIRPTRPPGYKAKLEALKAEQLAIKEKITQARESDLAAGRCLEDLVPLGDLCQSTAEHLTAGLEGSVALRPIPSGGQEVDAKYNRVKTQIYNLLVSSVLVRQELAALRTHQSEVDAILSLTLEEINKSLADKLVINGLTEHMNVLSQAYPDGSPAPAKDVAQEDVPDVPDDSQALVPTTSSSKGKQRRIK